jgi:hypothetical protein
MLACALKMEKEAVSEYLYYEQCAINLSKWDEDPDPEWRTTYEQSRSAMLAVDWAVDRLEAAGLAIEESKKGNLCISLLPGVPLSQ